MPVKTWSDAATETLKRMVREGYSAGMISSHLKVTRSAVVGRCHRLGLHLGANRGGMKHTAAYTLRKAHRTPLKKHKPIPAKPQPQFQNAPIPPPNINDIARKTFSELTENDCRYPINHVGEPGFGFCGLEKLPGSSYCPSHHSRCWVGVPAKKRSPVREAAKVMA